MPEFELVDIKDFNLPLLDEPMSPMMIGPITLINTRKTGPLRSRLRAYVLVTPEYNHATSGALKNCN